MDSLEPLPHFVDDYLGYLHELSADGGDLRRRARPRRPRRGLHPRVHRSPASRPGRLRPPAGQHPPRRADRRRSPRSRGARADVRGAAARARAHPHRERNPQFYADTLATTPRQPGGVRLRAGHERARRLLSKLRQAPVPRTRPATTSRIRPASSSRRRSRRCAGCSPSSSATCRGRFAELDDLSLLGDLADASTEASQAIGAYADQLETDVAPKARGSFRLGRERFADKLRLDEGITARRPAAGHRRARAERHAGRVPRVAAKIDKGDAVEVWRKVKDEHPAPGRSSPRRGRRSRRSPASSRGTGSSRCPSTIPWCVGADAAVLSLDVREHVVPGSVREQRAAVLLLPHRRRSGLARRAAGEHLRDFNRPTLWSISMHEVYPGHYLHFQHLRRDRLDAAQESMTIAPMSVVEGWAHYAEHLMVEQGFGKKDHGRRTRSTGRIAGPARPPDRRAPAARRGL